MIQIVTGVLVLLGAFLSLAAAVGIVRLPDLYSRMHASSKAGALGGGFLMAAAAAHFGTWRAAVEAGCVIAFIVLTAPVAAHMIARAAHRTGERLWAGSVRDDLGGGAVRDSERRDPDDGPKNGRPPRR